MQRSKDTVRAGLSGFPVKLPFGGSPLAAVISAPLLGAAIAGVVGVPAQAACLQSGSSVTCSGASVTGFGTGVENNLSLTVQSNGSITVGAAQTAVNLGSGNAVTNSGTIVVGNSGIGIQGVDNNIFTNAGTMTLGSSTMGIFALGNNNALSNSGTIGSTAQNGIGLDVLGSGNTVTNSGTITLIGAVSYGLSINGDGNTISNSGTIVVGSSGTGTNGTGIFLLNNNKLTNTGTITAAGDNGVSVSVWGDGNTVTNSGLINATGASGIAIGVNGLNATIVNNGTVRGGPAGTSLFSFGTSGSSIVNNGTLDGQIFFVGSGNSLTNSGLITITDPATPLAAGNLNFGGTFTQTAQGTLALRVDNTGLNDSLAVDKANLNGTLRAAMQPGLFASSTTYKDVVVGFSSVSGQFAKVTSSAAFFGATATYNPNSVDLTLMRYGFGNVPGETANQRAVGNALETGYSTALTGAAATFYTRLLQASSLRVLDQLSGEGTSGTQNTAFAAGGLFGQTMDNQMSAWRTGSRSGVAVGAPLGYAAERPSGPASAFNAVLKAPVPAPVQQQWSVWAAGFGVGQSLSGNATIGSASFTDRSAGGSMGVDYLFNPDLLLGVAVGGSSSTFSVDDRATSGRVEGGHVGAYAMQRLGASYLSAQIAYSRFDNTTTRTVSALGSNEIIRGSFASDQFGGRFEVGRSFDLGNVAVTPFAAIQAARLWQGAYGETSTAGAVPGALALNYAAHAVSSLPAFLGAKFDSRIGLENGMIWAPFVHVAWVHEFEPSRNITASLTGVSSPAFTVEGARAASDAARVDLGSRFVLNSWSELSARVTGEFSSLGQSYAGTGALKVSW